jgi:guanylate kinase
MPDVSAGPPPLLAIVGPSGSGKSSLVRDLARRGEVQVIATFTTRPRRPDEPSDCPDHRFVTEEEFAEFAQSGTFMATGALPGLPYRYGLPKLCRRAGPIPAVVLRAFVASELARRVPGLLVYQIEDRPDRIYPRLIERGAQDADTCPHRFPRFRDMAREARLSPPVYQPDHLGGPRRRSVPGNCDGHYRPC